MPATHVVQYSSIVNPSECVGSSVEACVRPWWDCIAAAWPFSQLRGAARRWGAPGRRRARPDPETSRRRCEYRPDPPAPPASPSQPGPCPSRWCRGSHRTASADLERCITHTFIHSHVFRQYTCRNCSSAIINWKFVSQSLRVPCWEPINKTSNNIMPLATHNLILWDRKCTDVRVVCLHNIPVIRDQTETRTNPHSPIKFHSVAIGNPFNFVSLLPFLRECKWSTEATQGGTNNHFITITPQGAMGSEN